MDFILLGHITQWQSIFEINEIYEKTADKNSTWTAINGTEFDDGPNLT